MSEKPFTILIVDDNAINRRVLTVPLNKQGYNILNAESGMEALRFLEEEPVDLIILDIMMPVMSGLEVLKRVRESYSQQELPVIMATAKSEDRDMVEAFDLGANDYITKPLNFAVALARIQAHLRTKGAPRSEPRSLKSLTSLLDIEAGTVLGGKYRLDLLIGSGHHGVVYKGTHLELEREVAVKLLQTGIGSDESMLVRFKQEGISGCRIQHPNAVGVLDFSATDRGIAFLVMELLEGYSLEDEIRRAGGLSPERCGEVLLPVLDVLAEAHSLGIIHRDIKPENIFLHQTRRGEMVKVLDFGIAKLMGSMAMEQKLTLDGIAGTPAYLAPERVSEEAYDGRADVYSVGIMLYEMLTGRLPYDSSHGSPLRMVMMHVNEDPIPIRKYQPNLSAELEAVIDSALRKDFQRRPDATQLADALAAAVGIDPPSRLPEPGGEIPHQAAG